METIETHRSKSSAGENGQIPSSTIGAIEDLLKRGQYVTAYRMAVAAGGPLHEWKGLDRLTAGWLASNAGGQRLADRLYAKAWRDAPTDPKAIGRRCLTILRRRGPLQAWEFLQRHEKCRPDQSETEALSDWCWLQADVYAQFRDFAVAEQWVARAIEATPADPFVWVTRSQIRQKQDRYAEADADVDHALSLRPWYRPAVQAKAELLYNASRTDEAVELLREAARHLESGAIWVQLAFVLAEVKRYAEAGDALDRIAEFYPVIEKSVENFVASRRYEAAYGSGDYERAEQIARDIDESSYYGCIADRLAESKGKAPAEVERKELPVGFILQHESTCAPTILATIANFWNEAVDHLELAAAICYDGTPHHSQRRWAEERGWVVREFAVDWESTVALIDRGVPFVITTGGSTWSHAQAIIGYDARLGMVLICDPNYRILSVAIADRFFETYRSSGPRGMALVPAAEAARLDGVELRDIDLYDRCYAIESNLWKHNRLAAKAALDAILQSNPSHRLAIEARGMIANYDADPAALLQCADDLIALYPDDGRAQLMRLSALRRLARRTDLLGMLQDLANRKQADPAHWCELGMEMYGDRREHPRTIQLAKRCIRFQPSMGRAYLLLADCLEDDNQFDASIAVFRFASCLEDKNEWHAERYFWAARRMRKTQEAMEHLRKRWEAFSKSSAATTVTLVQSLVDLDRVDEAFRVLESSLQQRPEDGELLLSAARFYYRHQRLAQAEAALAKANGKCNENNWLRAAAELAEFAGERQQAAERWRSLVEREPLNVSVHQSLARLLEETEGDGAAQRYFEKVCAEQPMHHEFHRAWLDHARRGDPETTLAVTQKVVALGPRDATAHRELAWALGRLDRYEEAFAAVDVAEQLQPGHPVVHWTRGYLLTRQGDREGAGKALRQCIRLSIDADFAINSLMELATDAAERRETLYFIQEELIRQVTFGDGLLAFRFYASEIMDSEELLSCLRAATAARPDLWQSWSALAYQFRELNRLDEALATVDEGLKTFPLNSRLWFDRSMIHRRQCDRPGERAALERASELSPNDSPVVHRLAEVLQQDNELPAARRMLEIASSRSPESPVLHTDLAQLLWKMGEKEAALERVVFALRQAADYDRAWDNYEEWTGELGRKGAVAELARKLAADRAGQSNCWRRLSHCLINTEQFDEGLAAAERAIALDSRDPENYDAKAAALVAHGRYEDAIAACRPPLWGNSPPLLLRGRVAAIRWKKGDVAGATDEMEAVLAEHPTYDWGRNRLIDWYESLNQHEDVRRHAAQAVAREPDDVASRYQLAGALYQLGRQEEAAEEYRRCLEFDPSLVGAGLWLFDIHLENDRLEEAETSLQAINDAQTNVYCVAREIQLARKKQNPTAAAAAFERLCTMDMAGNWPIQTGVQEMCAIGQLDAAAQILERQYRNTNAAPGYFAAGWAATAEAYLDANRLDEYMAVCNLMISARPEDSVGFGFRADGHERRREFESAIADCWKAIDLEPAYYYCANKLYDLCVAVDRLDEAERVFDVVKDFATNSYLAARRVNLACRRGDSNSAAQYLQQLLTLTSEGAWPIQHALEEMTKAGWQETAIGILDAGAAQETPGGCVALGYAKLADMYERETDREACFRFADAALRLDPNNYDALLTRAKANIWLKKESDAVLDYEKALALNPDCEYVGVELADLHTDEKQFERSLAILDGLPGLESKPYALGRQVELNCELGRKDPSLQRFGQLVDCAAANDTMLERGVNALAKSPWASDADEILDAKFLDPDSAPTVGTAWAVRWIAKKGLPGVWKKLRGLSVENPAVAAAHCKFVSELADKSGAWSVGYHLWRYQDRYRYSDSTWGAAGYALTAKQFFSWGRRWHADWRSRSDAQSWMLSNHAECLIGLNELDEALAVVRYAFERPDGRRTDAVTALAAFDAALREDTGLANALAAELEPTRLKTYDRAILSFVRALAIAKDGLRSGADSWFAAAAEQVEAGSKAMAEWPVLRATLLRRTIKVVNQKAKIAGISWFSRLHLSRLRLH